MLKTIYLPRSAKAQLSKTGINPWHQPIPFSEKQDRNFPKKLDLEDDELKALASSFFFPGRLESKIPEIAKRISLDEYDY